MGLNCQVCAFRGLRTTPVRLALSAVCIGAAAYDGLGMHFDARKWTGKTSKGRNMKASIRARLFKEFLRGS